jgi:hypothetical protein
MNVELRDYFAAKAMACLITETGLILDTFADDAYEIADKMMRALPLIGADSSKLNFKLFDGKTLNIPTGSMERIICFDSFHHLKDQNNI